MDYEVVRNVLFGIVETIGVAGDNFLEIDKTR